MASKTWDTFDPCSAAVADHCEILTDAELPGSEVMLTLVRSLTQGVQT